MSLVLTLETGVGVSLPPRGIFWSSFCHPLGRPLCFHHLWDRGTHLYVSGSVNPVPEGPTENRNLSLHPSDTLRRVTFQLVGTSHLKTPVFVKTRDQNGRLEWKYSYRCFRYWRDKRRQVVSDRLVEEESRSIVETVHRPFTMKG